MSEQYQNYTYQSPFALKRWLHQKRFEDALHLLKLKPEEAILDYGCGDGHFLEIVAANHNHNLIFGYEPAEDLYIQAERKLKSTRIAVAKSLESFGGKRFDKIICMETCEHLPEKELSGLFENVKAHLSESGVFVVSVPIETGFPAMAKNAFRFLKDPHYDNLTLKNYFRVLFGMPVQRKANQSLSGLNYIFSHIGFNFKRFEKELSKHFLVKRKYCSPVDLLGSGLNNTIYYRCTLK